MQGIIFLIIVIWAINRIAKARKKASRKAQNRIEPTRPQNTAPVQQAEQAEQHAAPVKSAPESVKVLDMCGMLNESDKAPTALDEGNSRTCDHGSIGGSMEAADHQGMGEAFVHAQQQVQTRVKAAVETKVKTQVHVSRKDVVGVTHAVDDEESPVAELTPEQMRRAVVMAEILKRPCERQRRWSAR